MQEQDAMSLVDEDIVALLAMNLNAHYERLVSLSTYHGHSQWVNDVAWSDGTRVVSASVDGTVQIWQIV